MKKFIVKHKTNGSTIGTFGTKKEASEFVLNLVKLNKICLNTMRCDDKLDDAVQWFKDNDIELYGVNENPKISNPKDDSED